MPRSRRLFISREIGLYHITSQVTGGDFLFGKTEKAHFLKTLERFARGFFVHIHAFAIMSNHIHILASERTQEAMDATKEELFHRHQIMYGEDAEPPIGRTEPNGCVIPDLDGGVERLRSRLGSISRFVQELKQSFARWYNKRSKRRGYLWNNRFHVVAIQRGDPELVCSAYIENNAVRAGIVRIPDEYHWCSLGLRVSSPERADSLLAELLSDGESPPLPLPGYRLFAYRRLNIRVPGMTDIDPKVLAQVDAVCARLGMGDQAGCRVRNFSEGVAMGSHEFVAAIQQQLGRRFIRPRALSEGRGLYCTRRLASS